MIIIAIKMEGNTVNQLWLIGANGQSKVVPLTEEGTIPTPTQTKNITSNGTNIDVLNYSKVNVNVPVGSTTKVQSNKTVTPTTSQQTVAPDSTYDALAQVTVNAIPSNYIIPSGTKDITANGTNIDVKQYEKVNVSVAVAATPSYQAKTGINPSTSSQIIRPDNGYDALSSVQINAMPSGTAGTPVAEKGTVSNNQVTITPKVTNTTGYITGSTKTGTGVTVKASDLTSGNKAISANGNNIDVTNYKTVSVNVPTDSSGYDTSDSTVTSDEAWKIPEQEVVYGSGGRLVGTAPIIADSFFAYATCSTFNPNLNLEYSYVTAPFDASTYHSYISSNSSVTIRMPSELVKDATYPYFDAELEDAISALLEVI